jgi:hypothetical protein
MVARKQTAQAIRIAWIVFDNLENLESIRGITLPLPESFATSAGDDTARVCRIPCLVPLELLDAE